MTASSSTCEQLVELGSLVQVDDGLCSRNRLYATEKLKCLCGAPGCRKVVKDFSTLPPRIRGKYISWGIVMSFIARRLRFRITEGKAQANLRIYG